jgi:ABC-type branched-subunit amino acid transport system substrate-binding protein
VTISQVVPFPWSPLTPVVKEYLDLCKRAGNVEVNFSTLEGFLAAKVMTEGLRRAGKELTRERFIAAMESINNHDLGGFSVSFSATNHNASRFVDLAMIGREGKFVR